MFYHLIYSWRHAHPAWRILNIFQYITVRSALAVVTSFVVALLIGAFVIKQLRRLKVSQYIREDGPGHHHVKAGTPTMGGVIVVIALLVSMFLWSGFNQYTLFVTVTFLGMGIIGFADDYLKLSGQSNKGLTATAKFISQFIIAAVVIVVLYIDRANYPYLTSVYMPFLDKPFIADMGILFVPFGVLVVVAFTNAINLTDGLDGLAIGLTVFAAAAFAVICYVSGHFRFAKYLNIPFLKGTGEIAIFCAALVGAGLGFLWFNAHPAKVFMGDVGALSLGGTLGIISILTKKELLLVIIGGVFVAETLSVVIQVASYKLFKKRVFKMAPLHHHFELSGWSEPQVVIRFWIIGLIFAVIGLSVLKIK